MGSAGIVRAAVDDILAPHHRMDGKRFACWPPRGGRSVAQACHSAVLQVGSTVMYPLRFDGLVVSVRNGVIEMSAMRAVFRRSCLQLTGTISTLAALPHETRVGRFWRGADRPVESQPVVVASLDCPCGVVRYSFKWSRGFRGRRPSRRGVSILMAAPVTALVGSGRGG